MKKRKIDGVLDNIKKLLGAATDVEMCEKMGWKYSTLDTWKNRDSIPKKRIYEAAERIGVSPFVIENGLLSVEEPNLLYKNEKAESGSSIAVPVLSIKASAGGGNNVESVDVFESGEVLSVDRGLFKVPPSKHLHAIQVDGYSMIPMLFPDSWVIFEDAHEWSGDGLYIINWRNVLMVKLLQADIENGKLWVKSVNPEYDSWHVDMENQENFRIFGKVVRCVI